jgi:excisionase family DNA binding protein
MDARSTEPTPIAVTIQTARKISGLGNSTIWKLISERRLDTVSVGRRRLILYDSLEKLLSPKVTDGVVK